MAEWIRVKDHPIPEDVHIIIWGKDLIRPIECTKRKYDVYMHLLIGSWECITHWMPMPKPPEENE